MSSTVQEDKEDRGQSNIWRNRSGNISKNYKRQQAINPKYSESPKQDKYK